MHNSWPACAKPRCQKDLHTLSICHVQYNMYIVGLLSGTCYVYADLCDCVYFFLTNNTYNKLCTCTCCELTFSCTCTVHVCTRNTSLYVYIDTFNAFNKTLS